MGVKPQRRDHVKEAQRRQRALFSKVFYLIAVSSLAVLLIACLVFPHLDPILLSAPEEAPQQLVIMLDAFCAGDYDLAASYMLDNPDLGAKLDTDNDLSRLLWDSLRDSLKYKLAGKPHTTDAGLALDVELTCLDLPQLTQDLRSQSQSLLEEKVAQTEDPSVVYDETGEFREDFVIGVLCEAVSAALEENPKTTTVTVTVSMQYKNGQWWVVADNALLDALFGGILF